MNAAENFPIVVIVGSTASGKSALALELARRLHGELIAADSRTIYRGLDIGTAKPNDEEQQQGRYHLLDVVQPNKSFTVVDFITKAQATLQDIVRRGNLPIVVGGTGLYVDALLFNFSFRKVGDPNLRRQLEKLSVPELQKILIDQDIPLPANEQNPRHLIRSIETAGQPHVAESLRPNTIIIGLDIPWETLKTRIIARVDWMIAQGLEKEVKLLVEKYGWGCSALNTIGYKEFRPYCEGTESLEQVRDQIIQNTTAYARRQRTWFRRNKSIQWFQNREDVVDTITTFLNNYR